MLAGEVHGLAGPQAPDDVQELIRAGIAAVLVEEVAVGALLVALAAGDDVEQQPSAVQDVAADVLDLPAGRVVQGVRTGVPPVAVQSEEVERRAVPRRPGLPRRP
jgi:hypothetical protein